MISPTGGISLGGKTVSFSGLPAKTYIIEWWNTWTGEITTENKNHAGGAMSLTVPAQFTNKDIALKIIPENGYPGLVPPSVLPSPAYPKGDVDRDGDVDKDDAMIILTNWITGTDIRADINDDGKVNGMDFWYVIRDWSFD